MRSDHGNLRAGTFWFIQSSVGIQLDTFAKEFIIIWVWVNTYRYIFSGMNIHLPAILGFTRYQGFDPSPFHPRILLCVKFDQHARTKLQRLHRWGTIGVTGCNWGPTYIQADHDTNGLELWLLDIMIYNLLVMICLTNVGRHVELHVEVGGTTLQSTNYWSKDDELK